MLKYLAAFSVGFVCASALFIFVIVPNYHPIPRRVYPRHYYELSEQPKFLTEELAIAKARETLTLEGQVVGPDQYDLHPVPDGHTKAPDGRIDQFLSRNAIGPNEFSPNRGSIMFTNPSATRYVSVELDGRILVCQTALDK
jgi:hypothetical protein